MAEVVQLHIEELLPAFKCLEEEAVFSRDEIQTIIKNIQNHEYKLQRSTKEKENGLKYINYLQCVLKLVQKKYDQMNVNINEDVRHTLIKKIKVEFRKLRDRHQRDVHIWMSFINFCKRNNHKDYVGKIYNRMLQVLPDRPELWISAAKWFLEGQNSWDNARKTFQKGLRSNKDAPNVNQLYLEFFRFELLFIEIILKRKAMLCEEANKEEQNDPLYDQLPESQIENDNIISGKVAMAVFREAIRHIDVEHVVRFLEILEDFETYSFSKDLKTEMLDFMEENYSEREETWKILRRSETSEENGIKRFKIADKEDNNKLKNDLDRQENEFDTSIFHFKSQIQINAPKIEIKNLFNKVLKIISNIGQLDCDVRKKCLDFIGTFVKWAISNLNERELLKVIEANCTVNPSIRDLSLSRQIAFYFKPVLLEQISKFTNGQVRRRQMYDKYKMMNPISKEFFTKTIELEIDELENGNKENNVKFIRRVFNEMLAQFGKDDHSLWLDFCEFELKFGLYVEISRIYEIAKKQLNPKESDLFVQNYSLLGKKLGY